MNSEFIYCNLVYFHHGMMKGYYDFYLEIVSLYFRIRAFLLRIMSYVYILQFQSFLQNYEEKKLN